MSFSGMDAVSGAAKTNVATFFFTLKPVGRTQGPRRQLFLYDLARKLYGMGFGLEQGSFIAFNPPPISGMSDAGRLCDVVAGPQRQGERGAFRRCAETLAEAANKRPELQGVSTSFTTANAPAAFCRA